VPKQVDPHERRTLLADALLRVAAHRGLMDVSLRHVAAEAGVTAGMVQHYFRTKDEMMIFALDVIAARRQGRARRQLPVIASVTINKPPMEVYEFYRRLEQLPQFMDYLASVTERESKVSHWVAKLPIGGTISWDARITEDRPGELIAWQSVEGSLIQSRGRVTFAKTPGRNMTEVRVEMQLGFLGTKPTTALAKFFGRSQIKGDLRRLKQVLETGEVLFSDASAHRGKHAAQPSPAGQPGSKVSEQKLPFIPRPATAEKGAVR